MIFVDIRKKLLSAHGQFTLDICMEISAGEFVSVFGQSGAGKTTLLRCIAGLEVPDEGVIQVNGEDWFDSSRKLMMPPRQRRVGYMFQDYALFPNMTVRENLHFARNMNGDPGRIDELIELMGLGELQQRKPAMLSGGQKQRVALARALAMEPGIMLLDEPFSALDHATSLRLQNEVMSMQRRFGVTTIMISHDISEVYKLSQRVLLIEHGTISGFGTPSVVFREGLASPRFSFAGEVLEIEKADVVYAVTLLVGNQVVRVIATPDEVINLNQGDRVTLMSKAFNPVLQSVKN